MRYWRSNLGPVSCGDWFCCLSHALYISELVEKGFLCQTLTQSHEAGCPYTNQDPAPVWFAYKHCKGRFEVRSIGLGAHPDTSNLSFFLELPFPDKLKVGPPPPVQFAHASEADTLIKEPAYNAALVNALWPFLSSKELRTVHSTHQTCCTCTLQKPVMPECSQAASACAQCCKTLCTLTY